MSASDVLRHGQRHLLCGRILRPPFAVPRHTRRPGRAELARYQRLAAARRMLRCLHPVSTSSTPSTGLADQKFQPALPIGSTARAAGRHERGRQGTSTRPTVFNARTGDASSTTAPMSR